MINDEAHAAHCRIRKKRNHNIIIKMLQNCESSWKIRLVEIKENTSLPAPQKSDFDIKLCGTHHPLARSITKKKTGQYRTPNKKQES